MEMDPLMDASPFYVEKLGLNCDPFAEQPVPLDLIYKSSARSHQLNFLQHLCQFSQYILMVVGPEGSGKTTLKRAFIQETQNQLKICDLRAQEVHTVPILLQTIAERFGLPWEGAAQNLEQSVAETLTQDWRPWIIVVDDAESLRADVLEALLNLLRSHTMRGEPLHLVLFGEPGLQKLLNLPNISDLCADVLHRLDLELLDESELKAYIQYSLEKAGFAAEAPVSETDLFLIQNEGKGLYTEVNRLVRQHLMTNLRKNPQALRKGRNLASKAHAMWVLAAAILGVGFYMASDHVKSFLTVEEETAAEEAPIQFNTDEHASNGSVSSQAVAGTLKPEAFATLEPPAADAAVTPVSDTSAPTEANAQVVEATQTVSTDAAPATMASPASPNLSTESLDASLMPETNLPSLSFTEEATSAPVVKTDETAQVVTTPIALPEAAAPVAETPAAVPQFEAQAKPVVQEKVKPEPKLATASVVKVKAPAKVVEKHSVAKTNGSHFTLQLMGLSDKTRLNQLLATHHDKNLGYYETVRAGKAWYVVTYGDYVDNKKAKLAAEKLPAGLKQGTPWARTFASIDKEKQQKR